MRLKRYSPGATAEANTSHSGLNQMLDALVALTLSPRNRFVLANFNRANFSNGLDIEV